MKKLFVFLVILLTSHEAAYAQAHAEWQRIFIAGGNINISRDTISAYGDSVRAANFADSARAAHYADIADTVLHGGGGGSSLWQLGGGAYPFPAIVPVGDSSVVVTGSANLYVYNNGTAQATGYGNILFGDGADDGPISVTGTGNIAGGTDITIDGGYSIAVGDGLTVVGGDNAVFGEGNVEAGSRGLMSGFYNTDTGSYDFTAGEQNQILSGSENSVALGAYNVSSGYNAVSIGQDDSAFSNGDGAVAIGSTASALNNIVINSSVDAYVSNPVSSTVNLGADSGLYVFQPGNPVPELLVNAGTLSSQGTQLTDNTGRVLNGGNGAAVGFSTYSYVYQGDSIASDGWHLLANVIAFDQSSIPLQTVAVAGTYLAFNPSDTTGEGGNPITVNIGGTGIQYNAPALSTTYGDSYDVLFWVEIKVAGTIGGNPFEGWLSNGGYGNVFVLTDMLGVPITTAIQNRDIIYFTDGTFNVTND
jgi:hypothetical protein